MGPGPDTGKRDDLMHVPTGLADGHITYIGGMLPDEETFAKNLI